MFAALLLDRRLAFLALCALLFGAATPLAIAWAGLLPEERPPFRFHRPSTRKAPHPTFAQVPSNAARDYFAVTLLVFVTLSFVWQLPGFPRGFVVSHAAAHVPEPWLQGLLLFSRGFLIAIPAVAAGYSILRQNEIRIPLIAAGVLVPTLWLVNPWLKAALAAP
jgi:hypothetical protein